MTSPIHKCNRIMRLLKPYLEEGYTHHITERVLKVVNQLEKDELAYIMAKYVTLAELVPDGRKVKVGNAEEVRNYLNMNPTDYRQLAYHTSQKVLDIHHKEDKSNYKGISPFS